METIGNNNSIKLEKVCKSGCGLTQDEYEILLEDVERAIEDGNREYGYGAHGYLDRDKDHYPFLGNDIPERFIEKTTNSKLAFNAANVKTKAVKKSKLKRQEVKDRDLFLLWIYKRFEAADPVAKEKFDAEIEGVTYNAYIPERPSIEELAIRRGIIKVHQPQGVEQ